MCYFLAPHFCLLGCYVGKHPVSALNELCARKKWTIQYELVAMSGPPHSRNFKYQVTKPALCYCSARHDLFSITPCVFYPML